MRYLVLGAGGIGSAIGGRLHEAGNDVVLIARGEHLAAMRERGLELRDPDRSALLDVVVAGSPAEAGPRPGDVVVVSTKTQQTEAALVDLAAVAAPGLPVICAQNGVENERIALRRFSNVYGMRVMLAATFLEPGVVEIGTSPVYGILDIGRYPEGIDDLAVAVVSDLRGAGFDSEAREDVMAYKYLKLLSNLANAVEAAVGPDVEDPVVSEVNRAARAEALACFEAAGIETGDSERDAERRHLRGLVKAVSGGQRLGGSSWQSLKRATGNVEADFLNGEIVLLGRLHGVPTPVNERLQLLANEMARTRAEPGSVKPSDLLG